jgi:deazaflavin-dependent oxidoreductase (nitroreductase family)
LGALSTEWAALAAKADGVLANPAPTSLSEVIAVTGEISASPEQFVTVTRAVIDRSAMMDAITWATQVAEYATKLTGVTTIVTTSASGPMFGVSWLAGVDTPEELDKISALGADAGYLGMLADAGANKLFEQGSSERFLLTDCPEQLAQDRAVLGAVGAVADSSTMTETAPHYRKPGWFTQHVFNPTVAGLTRLGISVWGSRVLEVKGRTSGTPRRVPVNLLRHGGREYLVSPRGEGQWVRNVRAADGNLDLLLGRQRQHRVATEIADADKVEILRAYLKRWKAEVGVFFDGTSATSTDEQLLAIAPKHPVFILDEV